MPGCRAGVLVDHAGQQIVGELLGLGDNPIRTAVAKLAATADGRAQVLGMVLAALEGRTPKDAWRQANATWTPTPGPGRLLRFLAANGSPYLFSVRAIQGVVPDPVFVPARQKAGRTGVAVELGSQPRGCNRAATTVQRRKPILLAVRAARPGAATR
jgi:hypothetical protein